MNETEVGISANGTKFTAEMDRMAQSAMTAGQRIQSALREAGHNASRAIVGSLDQVNDKTRGSISLMEHYKGAIAAIGTVVGSISAVALASKRFVDAAYEATYQAGLLGAKLGLTAQQANILNQTVENSHSNTATLEQALAKITQTLDNNEKAFQALGIATRDANGQLRPTVDILMETNSRLMQVREGTDRNIEMQRIYGRSWQEIVPILGVTREAAEETEARMRALGLVLGEENVEAADAYNGAMDDVGMVMKGIGKTIGDALMPVLTKLGEWFSTIGPGAVTVIKGAVGGLTAAFWLLKNGVTVVWETLNAFVVTAAEPIRAIAASIARLVQGDFSGARMEIQNIGRNMAGAWRQAMREIETSSRETRDKIWNLFAAPTAMDKPAGGLSAHTEEDKPGKKTKKAASGKQMSEAAWKLEEEAHLTRTLYQLAQERAEAEEAAYERAIKAAEEWESNQTAANKAVAAAAKLAAEQRAQVELIWSQNAAAAQLAVVDAEAARARHAVDLGLMTHEELLAQETEFEQRRNAIRAQALQERLALIDPEKDPVAYAQVLAAIEELERQHQARLGNISMQAVQQQAEPIKNIMGGIEQSMSGSLQKLMQGQATLAQFMRSIWRGVANSIIAELSRIIAKKAATWVTERAMAMAGIGADAAKAGSGAASSQASIPYVGPLLAVAAMASVFAAVSGMSAKVPSAAGGYDIPAGLNPLTQLHEKEMVLPAKYADVLRGLAAGQGGEAQAGDVHFHLSAVDGASVRRLFMDHGPALADALKAQVRNFRA